MIDYKKEGYRSLFSKLLLKFSGIVLLLLITAGTMLAQEHSKITGRLVMGNEVLAYNTVALQHVDGKKFKGTLTDAAGHFSFVSIPFGTYQLAVSGMGLKPHLTTVFSLTTSQPSKHFDSILMETDANQLNAVQITASKKVVEQQPGKVILHVENSLLAEGNTALEVLERAPGIKTDAEGKISLNGRAGVMVMINHKPTYLSAAELAVLLKGTNSSSISKIEILSQPSAKFDAAGNAGIVNIIMKKNLQTGLNGTVNSNAGAGRKARYGSGISLNYKSAKVNLYTNYNYAFRGETEYLDFTRRFNGGAENSVQRTETDEPLHTHNFRFGMDIELDTTNILGFLVNGNMGKYIHDSQTTNQLSNAQADLISDMLTTNYDRQNWQSLTYNLNYQHRFAKKDRLLTADVDYVPNRFNSNLYLHSYTRGNDGLPQTALSSRRGIIPSQTNVYVAKLDYQDSFKTLFKLETGWKASFTQADNDLVYQQLRDNQWQYDANGSNHFKYDEQIHAAYMNLHAAFGKFTFQAGLRAEYTAVEGNQVTTAQVFNREYFQLFPNLSIANQLTEKQQLQFAYGSRVERPNYSSLNPFRVYRDPSLYYEGNPFLTAERTQNFSFSHVYNNIFTTTLSYSKTKDVITWVTAQDDASNTTAESPQNLPALVNYGISFTAQHNFFNWWTGTSFANIFRNAYDLGLEKRAMNSFSLNTQQSFKLGAGFSTELNAYYNAGSIYGIMEEKSYWAISTALQKTILGNKGSLKLAVNDIFQTNNFSNHTRFQNINMNSSIWVDSRRVLLSFSYKFGKQFSAKDRRSASEDLQQRIGK